MPHFTTFGRQTNVTCTIRRLLLSCSLRWIVCRFGLIVYEKTAKFRTSMCASCRRCRTSFLAENSRDEKEALFYGHLESLISSIVEVSTQYTIYRMPLSRSVLVCQTFHTDSLSSQAGTKRVVFRRWRTPSPRSLNSINSLPSSHYSRCWQQGRRLDL